MDSRCGQKPYSKKRSWFQTCWLVGPFFVEFPESVWVSFKVLHCSPKVQRHEGLLDAQQTLNCLCGCLSMCVSPAADLRPVHHVHCLLLKQLYCSCDPEHDKWFTKWMNVEIMQSVIETLFT